MFDNLKINRVERSHDVENMVSMNMGLTKGGLKSEYPWTSMRSSSESPVATMPGISSITLWGTKVANRTKLSHVKDLAFREDRLNSTSWGVTLFLEAENWCIMGWPSTQGKSV